MGRLKRKKSIRQNISLGHKRKRAVSPNALGSDGSRNKGFNKEQEYDVSINSDVALETWKPFSSSGSATQKPS